MSKYYIPSSDEFRIGFEYEVNDDPRSDKHWSKITVENYSDLKYPCNPKSDGEYRVKYLDSTDFWDAGWKDTDDYDYQFEIEDCRMDIYKLGYSPKDMPHSLIEISDNEGNILFKGTIKNKSELSIIMEMVGIS